MAFYIFKKFLSASTHFACWRGVGFSGRSIFIQFIPADPPLLQLHAVIVEDLASETQHPKLPRTQDGEPADIGTEKHRMIQPHFRRHEVEFQSQVKPGGSQTVHIGYMAISYKCHYFMFFGASVLINGLHICLYLPLGVDIARIHP